MIALRLDALISELIKCSRKKANEIISEQRVYVNYDIESRSSFKLKENDVIVIRGKGKYNIKKILGKNKKGKLKVEIEKFI